MAVVQNLLRRYQQLPLLLEAAGARATVARVYNTRCLRTQPCMEGLYTIGTLFNSKMGLRSFATESNRKIELLEDIEKSNSALVRQNDAIISSVAVLAFQLERANEQGAVMISLQQRVIKALEHQQRREPLSPEKSLMVPEQGRPWTRARAIGYSISFNAFTRASPKPTIPDRTNRVVSSQPRAKPPWYLLLGTPPDSQKSERTHTYDTSPHLL